MLSACLALSSLPALPAPASAAVPQLLNYQGKMGDASGNPLTGTYDMRFRLCADSGCATPLYDEEWDSSNASGGVPVANGIYTVQIGTYKTLPVAVFNTATLYLELSVQPHTASSTIPAGSCSAPCETLTPRERVIATGFALHALVADQLGPGATAPYGVSLSTIAFAGQTSNVPGSDGMVEYRTDLGELMIYTNSAGTWVPIGSGSGTGATGPAGPMGSTG